MHGPDVPSPIDLCDPEDAREWESKAQARPGRADMFQAFAAQLGAQPSAARRVLELGSGPGFLAEYLLRALPDLDLTLLDFSIAMHDLARVRLQSCLSRVRFLHQDFKDPDWMNGLGVFDAVITNQAVHELRHKRYAQALHSQVRGVLRDGAPYFVCDHFFGDGGLDNDRLYMTVAEHRQALLDAGFEVVDQIHKAGSLVMHRAAQKTTCSAA